MLQPILQSPWYDQTVTRPERPSYPGKGEFEFAVIGAGLLGLSAAWRLAAEGRSVVLLEAGRVAGGASGRNGGFALPGIAASAKDLRHAIGDERGRAMFEVGRVGANVVCRINALSTAGIDLTPGMIRAACRVRHLPILIEEYSVRQHYVPELDFTVLDSAETARLTGSDLYEGGIFDSHSACINPLKLALEIARLAEASGASIYEESPVAAITDHGDGTDVALSVGGTTLRARHVLVCANVHNPELTAGARGRLLPATTGLAVTRRLTKSELARVLPARVGVMDTQPALDYYRVTPDGRLLFGGDIRTNPICPADVEAYIADRIRKVFPFLPGGVVESGWSGWIDMTSGFCPELVRTSPRVWAAHGLNGHGVATTVGMGQVIGAALVGQPDGAAALENAPNMTMPMVELWRHLAVPMVRWWYATSDRLGIGYGSL